MSDRVLIPQPSPQKLSEFSFRTRARALERFEKETFDVLIVGGGITGAAVARDATSRGLKVALVEKRDFAWGTSSRSSKLIHGGLRYLENFEFGLVFEALSERALLLRTVPQMVRPLPFYFPVFKGDPKGKNVLDIGLWLYDLLALFRTPGFHRRLSKKKILRDIPFLKQEGLQGGFRYFDASMWDDVLTIEILRSASHHGAAVANYVEAYEPLWDGPADSFNSRITGFKIRDQQNGKEMELKAKSVVVCAGPWTDHVGLSLSSSWKTLLAPSKGVHLIFDLKRIPIPGAMVMAHPEDGRISFVIPRSDLGAGCVIVGTTDGPSPKNPEEVSIEKSDVDYILGLLNRYFPDLKLTTADIVSGYVGVRPLFAPPSGGESLQKVSREHHIEVGPGKAVIVAGGKYTTHRKMAEEIVDVLLEQAWEGERPALLRKFSTKDPVNPMSTRESLLRAQESCTRVGAQVPYELWTRFGGEALDVLSLSLPPKAGAASDPEGFPRVASQLKHAIQNEMVLHLEDFYFRRAPLFSSRKDHGEPWVGALAETWAETLGESYENKAAEIACLKAEIERRCAWEKGI